MGHVLGELWPIWPTWFTSSQPGHDALKPPGRPEIGGEMKGGRPEWTIRRSPTKFLASYQRARGHPYPLVVSLPDLQKERPISIVHRVVIFHMHGFSYLLFHSLG